MNDNNTPALIVTPSKAVFLDVDGGICNRRTHLAVAPKIGGVWKECDPVAIGFLNHLYMTDPVNTRFVLCSEWRKSKTQTQMQEFWDNAGLIATFHDDWRTPIREETHATKGHGHDVEAWLANHPKITDWITIDDENTYSPAQQRHQIKPDFENGLSLNNMHDAFIFLHGMHMLDASKIWQNNYALNNFG